MLQLVLGIAGTGKTTWVLREMDARAKKGRGSIFLVPEQFSAAAETMVLQELGDAGSAFVDVVSFRTLAERILRAGGGENRPVLGDAGRAVFVKQALGEVGDKLRVLRKSRRDTAFYNLFAQTLSELKTAGAAPEVLKTVAQKAADPKFSDIALVYEAYEKAIAGSALDPEDKLLLAARCVAPGFFEKKACYIDNFDGFTSPEYALLGTLMERCEAVYVTLCCGGLREEEGGLGLFSPVRATARRLLDRAERLALPAEQPLVLPTPRRSGVDALQSVNLILAGRLPKGAPAGGRLTLTGAPDVEEEAKLAAAEMRRLAAKGVSYSRMALVCRDTALYESAVRRAFSLYDIPWFCDVPDSIEHTAPVAFLRGALGLLHRGLTTEPILALLKSGLCGYEEGALSALDNYVFTWRPRAEDWRVVFERHPGGLLQKRDEAAEAALAAAEGVRSDLVPKVEAFIKGAKGKGVRALSVALYRLMDRFGAAEHLEEQATRMEKGGDPALAERSRRAWDLAMEMLDQMAALLGDEKIPPTEYDELFLLLVRSTDFGQVPRTLESAIFTSADRMRLADPDYCFVVGLFEGEFPRQVGYSGLLTHADRDLLVENGVEMPGSFQNRVLLEEMFLYRALTAPRKGLHLSWPARQGGLPRAMSTALLPLVKLLAPPPLAVEPAALSATPQAAFEQLAGIYRDNTPKAATLRLALQKEDGVFARQALALLGKVDEGPDFAVQNRISIQKLMGDTLTISPTRAESYFGCRFSYFMESVLGLRPRRRAALTPLESGTFVHYILEQVLSRVKEGFAHCDDESLQKLTTECADEFISANIPVESLRVRHLLGQIKQAAFSLLQYLRDWAKNSAFSIDSLELPIGGEGVRPLTLEGESGQQLRVVGKVDRVDILKKDGKTYLCILDYKTGQKKFDLYDVFYGLSTQMLIYMDVLCRQGGYENALPAGMLYLSSDPAPKSGGRGEEGGPIYRLDGLLLDDPAVLSLLDGDKSGVFLPVRYKGDGSLRAGRQLASLERIGGLSLYVEQLLREMAGGVSTGRFSARPLVQADGRRRCDYCPYRAACRHEYGRHERPMEKKEEMLTLVDSLGAEGGGHNG